MAERPGCLPVAIHSAAHPRRLASPSRRAAPIHQESHHGRRHAASCSTAWPPALPMAARKTTAGQARSPPSRWWDDPPRDPLSGKRRWQKRPAEPPKPKATKSHQFASAPATHQQTIPYELLLSTPDWPLCANADSQLASGAWPPKPRGGRRAAVDSSAPAPGRKGNPLRQRKGERQPKPCAALCRA